MLSSMRQNNRLWAMGQAVWLPMVVASVLVVLFLAMTRFAGAWGFPLDDAWIHQTYARSLAENGRWEYVPGVVSSGSTAPMWTLLLSFGYFLNLPYFGWAVGLGWLSFVALLSGGQRLFRQLWPAQATFHWLAVVMVGGTWPLIWAAVSGMETVLFAALGMWCLVFMAEVETPSNRRVAGVGILSGLLVLTRPDGVVLVLLGCLWLLLRVRKTAVSLVQLGLYLLCIAALLVPYFIFNYSVSDTIWPNTFYAKQAEYAMLLETPLWRRVLQLLFFSVGGASAGWQGMSGAHLLLLPGLILSGLLSMQTDWQNKRLWRTLPLLWAGGHIVLYAWRLPLAFQHGRYLMAAFPVWVLFGLAGWLILVRNMPGPARVSWIVNRVAMLTYSTLLLFFLVLGARAYQQDVAFIENEMVNMAMWIDQNLPQNAVIATHDIGAIGYFAKRPLVDLAGLITPEAANYLSDEAQLAEFIANTPAQYLVTAPGWPYEQILQNRPHEMLYTTNYDWTRENDLNNMTIYLLKSG